MPRDTSADVSSCVEAGEVGAFSLRRFARARRSRSSWARSGIKRLNSGTESGAATSATTSSSSSSITITSGAMALSCGDKARACQRDGGVELRLNQAHRRKTNGIFHCRCPCRRLVMLPRSKYFMFWVSWAGRTQLPNLFTQRVGLFVHIAVQCTRSFQNLPHLFARDAIRLSHVQPLFQQFDSFQVFSYLHESRGRTFAALSVNSILLASTEFEAAVYSCCKRYSPVNPATPNPSKKPNAPLVNGRWCE